MELSPQTIQVWSVPLAGWPPEHLESVLSADERARASRFKFPHVRDRFIVGRGLLRHCLSHYLAVEPTQVQFGYGTKGKPFIATPALSGLSFNVSHSQDRAIFALSWDQEMGVDVEVIDPRTPYLELAARFFLPPEYQQVLSLPAEAQRRAFFQIWTRKEACIKLRGNSLGDELGRLQVLHFSSEPPASAHPIAQGWDLDLWANCAAAIAVATPPQQVQFWQWLPENPGTELPEGPQHCHTFEWNSQDFWTGWLTDVYNVGNDKKSR